MAQLAVEARGTDYIDSTGSEGGTPRYFDSDQSPSCLVGWVLDYLGIDKKMMIEVEAYNTTTVSKLVELEVLELDTYTNDMLTLLQELNDEGLVWGECLKEAEKVKRDAEVLLAKNIVPKEREVLQTKEYAA